MSPDHRPKTNFWSLLKGEYFKTVDGETVNGPLPEIRVLPVPELQQSLVESGYRKYVVKGLSFGRNVRKKQQK